LGTLESPDDQWAYLSTLDRLSSSDAVRVARRAKQTAVGSEVIELSRSAATRVRPRLEVIDQLLPGDILDVVAQPNNPANPEALLVTRDS